MKTVGCLYAVRVYYLSLGDVSAHSPLVLAERRLPGDRPVSTAAERPQLQRELLIPIACETGTRPVGVFFLD